MNQFEIIPYGNALDYLVSSRSRQGHHLVHLDSYQGNGACSCGDYQMNRFPLLRVIGFPSDSTRCEHIKAARRWLLDRQVIPALAAQKGDCSTWNIEPRPKDTACQ